MSPLSTAPPGLAAATTTEATGEPRQARARKAPARRATCSGSASMISGFMRNRLTAESVNWRPDWHSARTTETPSGVDPCRGRRWRSEPLRPGDDALARCCCPDRRPAALPTPTVLQGIAGSLATTSEACLRRGYRCLDRRAELVSVSRSSWSTVSPRRAPHRLDPPTEVVRNHRSSAPCNKSGVIGRYAPARSCGTPIVWENGEEALF